MDGKKKTLWIIGSVLSLGVLFRYWNSVSEFLTLLNKSSIKHDFTFVNRSYASSFYGIGILCFSVYLQM